MSRDPLKDYTTIRWALENERSRLMDRLQQIDAALNADGGATPRVSRRASKPRAENTMSLREAVVKVVTKNPLTKDEILKAVQGLGYQFSAKDPIASLNTLLYNKKHKFKNQDGRFSIS